MWLLQFATVPFKIKHFELPCCWRGVTEPQLDLSYLVGYLFVQVQGELKRKWRSMCLNCRLSRGRHFSSRFASRNGSEHMVQFHRNSRTPSILQSETTVLWGPGATTNDGRQGLFVFLLYEPRWDIRWSRDCTWSTCDVSHEGALGVFAAKRSLACTQCRYVVLAVRGESWKANDHNLLFLRRCTWGRYEMYILKLVYFIRINEIFMNI